MNIMAAGWQNFSLLTLVGIFWGMLGILSIIHDLLGRQSKVLHRTLWVFSSGFLIAFLLLALFLLVFGSQRVAAGSSLKEVWEFALVFSSFGFVFQLVFLSPPPQTRPPVFLWSNAIWPTVFSGFLLVSVSESFTPPLINIVIFALPLVSVIGALNGFAPAIQWWMLYLPEKRIAAIGAVLLVCAFILFVVQWWLNFLDLPL